MYSASAIVFALFLSATPQLASATPISAPLAQRQDSGLRLNGDCFGFSLDGSRFTASCTTSGGVGFDESTIDLNSCLSNQGGSLKFQIPGNAFSSCNSCSLNDGNLVVTCTCDTGNGNAVPTAINIDGTDEFSGDGVFVRDNGRLSCRAPGV
ncbi:hypothetical protein BCR34DRAFT_588822 [Clohesyomyces aquaticus]|uniref:Cyanovirin-N domain-containing protein n=1 Tax=Clohesyomyces aquaticus TaxID=1231657 RepID=A0A1Y1ZJB1_9PLEO|nr:hypothetical protein BCR34DRAFT_588822 [Clohesyomyces aquaticus]